jgi:hypothetical protein
MKRLADRPPGLDIFGQKLIARAPGEWRITVVGKALLLAVEQLRPHLRNLRSTSLLSIRRPRVPATAPAATTPSRRSQASPRYPSLDRTNAQIGVRATLGL